MDPKIAADLRPSADGSAVRTSLVAGGGSQCADSLGGCAMGQTDGQMDRQRDGSRYSKMPPRAGA